MAYTTINKPTDYFNTLAYTGNGSQSVTGVGFKPDLVWAKSRSNAYSHQLHDSVRGATAGMLSSESNAAQSSSYAFDSFDSNGFTTDSGNVTGINGNGHTQVAWNWKAGTSVSGNTSGSGTAKAYSGSVNTTSGFSIIKYTGNGTAGHTIPHHLGVAPKMIIVKSIASVQSWIVLPPTSDGYNKDMKLEDTSALGNSDVWNNTAATSTVFSVGSNTNMNGNNAALISYSFAEKTGYSKFGSYTGNGNANGTFVYTGFKPAFVMIKSSSNSGQAWVMQDNKRDGFNYNNHRLFANSNAGEESTVRMDLLSNGFKCRDNDGNGNGFTYIYMAFAEAPLVGTNGVTAKAR